MREKMTEKRLMEKFEFSMNESKSKILENDPGIVDQIVNDLIPNSGADLLELVTDNDDFAYFFYYPGGSPPLKPSAFDLIKARCEQVLTERAFDIISGWENENSVIS